jgi:hypothetical protein
VAVTHMTVPYCMHSSTLFVLGPVAWVQPSENGSFGGKTENLQHGASRWPQNITQKVCARHQGVSCNDVNEVTMRVMLNLLAPITQHPPRKSPPAIAPNSAREAQRAYLLVPGQAPGFCALRQLSSAAPGLEGLTLSSTDVQMLIEPFKT